MIHIKRTEIFYKSPLTQCRPQTKSLNDLKPKHLNPDKVTKTPEPQTQNTQRSQPRLEQILSRRIVTPRRKLNTNEITQYLKTDQYRIELIQKPQAQKPKTLKTQTLKTSITQIEELKPKLKPKTRKPKEKPKNPNEKEAVDKKRGKFGISGIGGRGRGGETDEAGDNKRDDENYTQ